MKEREGRGGKDEMMVSSHWNCFLFFFIQLVGGSKTR